MVICFCTLFFTNKLLADYTINAGTSADPATTSALRNATGTISIYGTMAINSDVTFTSSNPLRILIYGTSGQIYWYANKTLALPANSTIAYVNNPAVPPGLQPTSGNASQILEIGSVKYACTNDNSNNVVFSFVQLNSIGGTPTVSATTGTPSICYGSTASLSATRVLPSGVSYYFQWSVSPGSGNFSNNNTSAATSTSLSNASVGQNTVICGLYANTSGTNYYLVASDTVILTVKPTPSAPTYSVTQPTCSVASGNISVSAPTGAGLTYSADGAIYTNTTGAFSGMSAGAYNLTAKSSNGCISPISFVTVNAPPVVPAEPTASVTQPTCTVATGTVTITAPAGTGITYSTDDITYSNTSGVFSSMSPGTYNLTAKNSSGCISPVTSVVVNTQPARPTGTLSGSASLCNGSSASLNIAATGAGTISGLLSDGTVFSGTAPAITVNVSPLNTKTYTISSLTNGTCSSIASDKTGDATITVTTQPSATISYSGTPFCSNTGTGTVTFNGSLGGTFSSTASIDSNTGAVNLAATAPGTYTITYTVPASGGCSVYTTTTSIIINPNTWTGGTSTNWNTPANWVANGVVNTCPDFTVLSGVPYQPILNSGAATVQNLIINPGATLTITNATLRISGSINNSGTFDASDGTIEMNGNTAQAIPANTFQNNALNNLIISNTSATGVTLDGALDIYGSLTFSGSSKKLTTNDNLTIKSTAENTAWVGDMTGNTITGQATVERYIPAQKAWYFLSVPTNSGQSIQQAWQEGAASTTSNPVPGYGIQLSGAGGTAAGFDLYSAAPSLKRYDPASNAWIGAPDTKTTGIKITDGYMVFIRGDRTANAFNSPVTETVLRTKGPLYTQDQAPIIINPNKFAAIGNPYASALDFRSLTSSGLKDFFYIWDPKIGGQFGYGGYQTLSDDGAGDYVVTPGGGSYGASGSLCNYIKSGWAFFVQATPSGGSLTFKEAAKSNSSGQISTPARLPTPRLRANLLGFNSSGNSTYIADGLLVNYKDDYSNAVDNMDAIKQTNSSENLAVKNKNTLLVIERRHTIVQTDTIFLNLSNVKVQKYRFEFTADQIYQPGLTGFLEDIYLHTSTPLNIDGVTDIDFNVVNVAGSYAPNRFRIVFSQLSTLPVTFTSVKAYLQNQNINVEWKVDNEQNIKQYEVEKSVDGNHFTNLSVMAATAGNGHSAAYNFIDKNVVEGFNYYRIKSVDDNGKISYTNIVKVVVASTKTEIAVYPNPVVNGKINLQLNNQPEGNYSVRMFNKAGQLILEKKIQHSAGSDVDPIQLSNYIAHGIYELKVTKPDGSITSINIIYQ